MRNDVYYAIERKYRKNQIKVKPEVKPEVKQKPKAKND
jgi:hypothetical protein